MDFGRKKDRDAFWEAYQNDTEHLVPFRKFRRADVIEYLGNRYPQDTDIAARYRTIKNVLQQFIETYLLILAASRPRVRISSPEPSLFATARRFETAVNNVLAEISVERALADIVTDAMFRQGWAKICRVEGRVGEIGDNEWVDVGQPAIRCISLDNMVFDTQPQRWGAVRYIADEYRVPWDKLREDDYYDQAVVKKLTPEERSEQRQDVYHEKVADLGRGANDDPGFTQQYATLVDVWLPEEQRIAVVGKYGQDLPALASVEWTGAYSGPYEQLSFVPVPENLMPASPIDQLVELHRELNIFLRKSIRQGHAQKNNPVFPPQAASDMSAVEGAIDGRPVQVKETGSIGTLRRGGADQSNLAMVNLLADIANDVGGNIEALAGMGPQSETVGQDKLIYQQAGNKPAKYQQMVVAFTEQAARKLAHLVWHDEHNVVPGELPVPGMDESVPYNWSAKHRVGNFDDMHLVIDPYSMAYEAPSTKLAKFRGYISMLMEMWPVFQAEGAMLNSRLIAKEGQRLHGLPEGEEYIVFGGADPEATSTQELGQKHTQRDYTRTSMAGGPTPQNKRSMAVEQLAAQAGDGKSFVPA